MLGENFPDVGWPETGEIDIMEHRGNEQDVIHGSLHLPGNFGGNAISETTTIAGVSQEFNIYTVEWSADRILFAVNDVVYHEFENTSGTPFNNPFFLIFECGNGWHFWWCSRPCIRREHNGGGLHKSFSINEVLTIDVFGPCGHVFCMPTRPK